MTDVGGERCCWTCCHYIYWTEGGQPFEDCMIGLLVDEEGDLLPLPDFCYKHVPIPCIARTSADAVDGPKSHLEEHIDG
jgi:hypothetical protein